MLIGAIAVACALAPSAFAADSLDAVALPSSNGTEWNGLNDSDQIAGSYIYPGHTHPTAVRWQDGSLTALSIPSNALGGVNASAGAIDAAGGMFGGYTGADEAVTTRSYPVIWSSSLAVTAPYVGQYNGANDSSIEPSDTSASANGNTAGWWCGNNGSAYTPCEYVYALAPAGGAAYQYVSLSAPQAGVGAKISINDAGELAVGAGPESYLYASGPTGPMTTPTIQLAGTPYDLNDEGDIIGTSAGRPVIELADGTVEQLPTLKPGDTAILDAINDDDEVVGQDCVGSACTPVAWIDGKISTLASMISGGFAGSLGAPVDVNNEGSILVGQLGSDGIGYLLTAGSYTISGTLYNQQCNGDDTTGSCAQTGLGGINILVTGKDTDGNAVSKTATTAADGTWSVNVADGTYEAGPSADGTTFIGDAVDPESAPITVNGANVDGINFSTCADTGAATTNSRQATTSTRDLSASNDGLVAHNSGGYSLSLCKTDYTISLGASIPQKQIVDPSLDAPYNRSTSGKAPDEYPGETSRFGLSAYGWGFDSVFEKYPEYPSCFDKEQLEEFVKEDRVMHWYSEMSGGSLGTVKVPLLWNQHDQTVYYNTDAPSTTNGELTRTWHYYYDTKEHIKRPAVRGGHGGYITIEKRHDGSCHMTVPITPVYFPLPGGADRDGRVSANQFTAVVLWYIPFEPTGVVVPPETTAQHALSKILGEHTGEQLVEAWESLPWPMRFGFVYALGDGAVKTVGAVGEGLAHLTSSVKAAKSLISSLAKAESLPEIVHAGHSIWDAYHGGWPALTGFVSSLLGKLSYPVMGAVVRGQFDTQYQPYSDASKTQYVKSTTLAVSVARTTFPDISLSIDREPKPNNSSNCPVQSGILPWANTGPAASCTIVSNPFAANGTDLISHTTAALAGGKSAVDAIRADTRSFSPILTKVRESKDLESNLPFEQSLVKEPVCSTSGAASTPSTICWVFKDGRP